jgi:ATP-binding cassette subfamily C protein
MVMPTQQRNSLLLLLRDFYAQHPGRFLLVIVGLMFSGFSGGIGLAAFLPVIEVIIESDPTKQSGLALMVSGAMNAIGLTPSIGPLLAVIVLAIVAKSMLLLFAMLQAGFTAIHIITDLRMNLVRAALAARWDYFIERPLGTFANAINAEAVRSSHAFFAAFLFVSDVFQIVVYVGLAMLISWQLTLAAAIATPVMLLVFHSRLTMARSSGRAQTHLEKSVLARITDTLQGIKPIKAMGIQQRLEPIIEKDLLALLGALRQQIVAGQTLKTMQEPFIVFLICTAVYFLVTYGKVDTSVLIGLALLFYRTMTQLGSLQKRYQLVEMNHSAYRSLRGMIDDAKAATEFKLGADPLLRPGPIEFADVSLRLGHNVVLENIDLQLPENGLVCIVGPSGAGKTSLVDMIAGLYEPTSGEIRIAGAPLNRLDLLHWRWHLGYVPQEMILFNDTLRNNLTLGGEEYSNEVVWQALQRAGLRDVVEALPGKLETRLGERGARFSGGQRQRLAVARALIRNPKILILDEVTASLDPETERQLAVTLQSLADEMLILAITHQNGLLRHAKAIILIGNGHAIIKPAGATDETATP